MLSPILVADLFPEITRHLLTLLESLSPDEWAKPTLSSQRTVKDIATHLLDGSLRRLSMQRDGYSPDHEGSLPRAGESLVEFLNRLNAEWEIGTRRLSPNVLMSLIAWADSELARLFATLDPHGPAIFPVAWAGESESENWMDIARDYTEKWHHTQQIFEATGRPSTILTRRLGFPCYDTFLRALPYTFHTIDASVGTSVEVVIRGDAGGTWRIVREADRWVQSAETATPATAKATFAQENAWIIFTKRRPRDWFLNHLADLQFSGDVALASCVLDMVSVMA